MKKLTITILACLLVFTNVQAESIDNVNIDEPEETAIEYEPLLLAGYDFSVARLADGTWWSWGANTRGQLGLGDKENRMYPVRITTLPVLDTIKVKQASVIDTTVYIQDDKGTIYHWGQGTPLGAGTKDKPEVLHTNRGKFGHSWKTQFANRHDSIAYVDKGQVYIQGSGFLSGFGRGLSGHGANEKGDNSYSRSLTEALKSPVLTSGTIEKIPGTIYSRTVNGVTLKNVKFVAGSKDYVSFQAVTNDNNIYSWGESFSKFATIHKNNTITGNIVKVAADVNNYALTDRGEVWEWKGQQGAMTKLPYTNVKDVAAYGGNVFVLTKGGELFARGDDKYGATGGATATTFKRIATNVVAVGAGYRHTLYMTTDGKIYGLGWNAYRQLAVPGDGVYETFTKVPGISGATNIFSTEYTSMATKGSQLYTWGKSRGELGPDSNKVKLTKTFEDNIKELSGPLVDPGFIFSTLLNNGDTYVFGDNYRERLGYEGADYFKFKKIVEHPNNRPFIPNTINGITYVQPKDKPLTAGDKKLKTMGMANNGGIGINQSDELVGWGWSSLWGRRTPGRGIDAWDYGASGVGQKTAYSYIRLGTQEKFKKVAGGTYTKLALSTSGEVYSWGHKLNSSLGRSGDEFAINKIPGLSNIVDISMGYQTGAVLDKDGDIYTWGLNNIGQAGDGSIGDKDTPTNVTRDIDEKFVKLGNGYDSMFAITDKGELYAWGNNRYGQLGLGDRVNRTSPRKVNLPSKVKQVTNSIEHTILLLDNGDVYVAGGDSFGQLGMGIYSNTVGKTEIPFPDYVTIENEDNSLVELGSGVYKLTGTVTSVIDNYDLEIHYKIENSLGLVESGLIKKIKSSKIPVSFNKDIYIDKKYILGGHTLTVEVKNLSTKLNNSSAVNFRVIDTTPPKQPTLPIGGEWTNIHHTVRITEGYDNLGGSGLDYTEYKLNDNEWAKYTNEIKVDTEGRNVIQARSIDRAGTSSEIIQETYLVDKTPPTIDLKLSTNEVTHEDLTIHIDSKDALSGVLTIRELSSGQLIDKEFVVKKNGTYIFESTDRALNKITKSITVDNIDKTMSITAPTIDDNNSFTLNEKEHLIKVNPMFIRDYRDEVNNWRLHVSSELLTRNDKVLSPGVLWLKPNLITNGENVTLIEDWVPIDSGVTSIVEGFNSRGEHKLTLDNLKVVVDPGSMLAGKYSTTITWDLVQAP